MDAHAESKLNAFIWLQTDIEGFHGSKNSQASTYRPLGIIFMGVGIAEIDEQTVTKKLGDMSIKMCDHLGADSLIRTNHLSVIFRIKLAGEFGGIDQVTEHHRELSPFRLRRRRAW